MPVRTSCPTAAAFENAVSRPHELHDVFVGPTAALLEDEFPRDARVLHLLKLADAHFCNLAERYHALNRVIHRIECEVECASDLYLARFKRQRLALLDEIALMIEQAEARLREEEAEGRPPTPAIAPAPATAPETGAAPARRAPPPPAAGLVFGAREQVPA